MKKKKVIITLSRVYPATHKRAGELTGFEGKLKSGKKIHTIRLNAKGVWNKRFHDIESGRKYLSVREWTGRPYDSLQREFAQYEKIGLQKIAMSYGSDDVYPRIWIDDKEVTVQQVAANDGLSIEDFVDWFFGKSKSNTFDGVVIHFTDFRY